MKGCFTVTGNKIEKTYFAVAFTLAPFSIKYEAISKFELINAKWSGVSPSLKKSWPTYTSIGSSKFAFSFKSINPGKLPCNTAAIRGVYPFDNATIFVFAPSEIKYFNIGYEKDCSEAIRRGVLFNLGNQLYRLTNLYLPSQRLHLQAIWQNRGNFYLQHNEVQLICTFL